MSKYAYRMSEAGGCARVLSAIRLGKEPIPFPSWLITIMNESKRHEGWVIEDLRQEGYEVETGGVCKECLQRFGSAREGIHVELDYPLFRLLGHMDGNLPVNGHKRPLEIKALGRFTFQKFLTHGFSAFPKYAGQETCYMTAVGEENWPGFYIVKSRDTGRKNPFDVHEPPTSMDDIVDKINLVEAQARMGNLIEATCDESDMRYCQFRYLCSTPEKVQVSEITSEVAEAFKLWKDNHLTASQVDTARDTIKEFMVANKLSSLEAHDVLAQVTDREKETYPKVNLMKFVSSDVLMKCRKVTTSPRLEMKNLSIVEEE